MSQQEDETNLDPHLSFSPGFLAASPELTAWRAANTRPCCVLQVGGFRPGGEPTASHLGLSPVMRADEDWPVDLAGQPMQFIAQLNVAQAPWRPAALQDLALLQLFVGEQFIESGSEAGTYAIRTYPSLEGLAAREQPPFRERAWIAQGVEARWQAPQDDHPCYDDGDMVLPEGLATFPDEAHGECRSGTKIGGYATSLQHEVQFYRYELNADGEWCSSPLEPRYVLQIDSDGQAGLNWVDGGIVYLGRHPQTGVWSACCQFH
ncbi:hypothetical protein CCO03_10635 [Comamonas serinivorans]|uniref:DUF1963 domain-containing protein n=1 Tax=Comamonas serinivorans TaxID=1082851 RepID=A0A1Y0ENC5_9BURK|nr:DUF1963 domain-containing protein [Comamonas serinivorans]ARU05086.1 hypothetical protein CCO03_10635 [Comamonas serinivorans]